jgi:hypothetical protein
VKVYQVIFDDGREAEVVADTYMSVDGEFRFFANGQPIPDVFFREESVQGINVLADNHEDLYRWRGGGIPS